MDVRSDDCVTLAPAGLFLLLPWGFTSVSTIEHFRDPAQPEYQDDQVQEATNQWKADENSDSNKPGEQRHPAMLQIGQREQIHSDGIPTIQLAIQTATR